MILRSLLGGAAAAVLALGCTDTGGEFNDFQQRYCQDSPAQCGGGTGGGMPSCQAQGKAVPKPGQADGDFVVALSAKADKTHPLLQLLHITTTAGDNGGLTATFTGKALDACDRKTEVGPNTMLGPFAINADGSFDIQLPSMQTVGLANTTLECKDITSVAELTGQVCAPADFICGTLSGQITMPFPLSLDGSTFTMTRLAAPGMIPAQLKYDCQGDMMAAPPSFCATRSPNCM